MQVLLLFNNIYTRYLVKFLNLVIVIVVLYFNMIMHYTALPKKKLSAEDLVDISEEVGDNWNSWMIPPEDPCARIEERGNVSKVRETIFMVHACTVTSIY